MGSKWVSFGIAAVACALGAAAPAAAQFEDKTCLVHDSQFSAVIRKAALQLDFQEVLSWASESGFVAALKSKQWDLIGIERAHAKIVNKAEILDLFKQQHAGGAKFIVSYAHLDEWPELQEFLGLLSAVDVPLLSDAGPPPPGNPITILAGVSGPNPVWSDHGDILTPQPGGFVTMQWLAPSIKGQVAGVLNSDRTKLTCGYNFDEYAGTPSTLVRVHVETLVSCNADYNRDGLIDVFDFFDLQTGITIKDPPANRDYDGLIDVFDFFDFFNAFASGCTQ